MITIDEMKSNSKKTAYNLSEQELKTLSLAAKGLDNPHIGEKMFISSHTVKAHLAAVYRKLNVANRTEAVYVAVKKHLID